jgi:hypothetical protein
MRKRSVRLAAIVAAGITAASFTSLRSDASASPRPHSAPGTCSLGNGVSHVVEITFDNVHFFRDNPNVPSDLELMPHLEHFLEANGTILSNMHTPLIAHTAEDSLALYTGLDGDRHGQPLSNSYKSYHPDGTTEPDSSFVYWTSPVYDTATKAPSAFDSSPSMVYSPNVPAAGNPANTITPAPWVPFTRAGCNVGDFSTANMVLENTPVDINNVFGPTSPEAQQNNADPSSFKDQETADYVGEAIHCAAGNAVCATATGVKYGQSSPSPTASADVLPNEPGGYNGYQALFGHKYIAPQLGAGTPNVTHNGYEVTDASGNLVDENGQELQEPFIHVPGFTGFSPTASQTLAMMADMQESGVPVTYGYIADIHERKTGQSGCTTTTATSSGAAIGPGDSCYVQTAAQYDAAFATFFARLAADGITPANTEFVITAEENDHFAGANAGRATTPTPADCDGVTTPCNYGNGQIGELNANLQGLVAAKGYNGPSFDVEPQGTAVYVAGQPGPADTNVRNLERASLAATSDIVNPFNGVANEKVTNYLAGKNEQRVLHIESADPLRTPTFALFPKPDYFFGASNCTPTCVQLSPRFAWDHGYYSPDIDITWAAFAGPHVFRHGVDGPSESDSPAVMNPEGGDLVTTYSDFGTWADETDVRPTLLSLVGLVDDYTPDGRVLTEVVNNASAPARTTQSLGECYKQLYASVGTFGTDTLVAETRALGTGNAKHDTRYTSFEARLVNLANKRDALANSIKTTLTDAAFHGIQPSSTTLSTQTKQCKSLVNAAEQLAQ